MLKDWRGVPIKIGSVIVYNCQNGDALKEGVIIDITKQGELKVQVTDASISYLKPKPTSRVVTLLNYSKLAVVG